MQSINDLEIFKRAVRRFRFFLARKPKVENPIVLIAELGNKYTVFATIYYIILKNPNRIVC